MKAKHTMSRTCLVVLGMHRSGTSALTRVLSLLGADLPSNLLRGGSDNTSGYWESADLQQLNDSMLLSAGSSWSDWTKLNSHWYDSEECYVYKRRLTSAIVENFSDSAFFVLKDPRFCRFFPILKKSVEDFGAELRVILLLRNPIDVAASLQARDGLVSRHSHLLWLRHALDAEADSRGVARTFISYENLLKDWRCTVRSLAERLELVWPKYSASSERAIDSFLSPSMNHYSTHGDNVFTSPDITDWMRRVYSAHKKLQETGQDLHILKDLDCIRNVFDDACANFSSLVEESLKNAELRQELDKTRNECGILKHTNRLAEEACAQYSST